MPAKRTRRAARALALGLLALGCTPYAMRHENQWDSREQIWLSDASQVRLRAAQSRVLETADRTRTLEAVVSAFQDLGFQVDVLDEVLGIVSGRRFDPLETPGRDPYYHLYDDESLIVFVRSYRTWGPFHHRSNAVRLTVTVRPRSERQLVVRASAQHYLRAVEDPAVYQRFFRTLEQALFIESRLLP